MFCRTKSLSLILVVFFSFCLSAQARIVDRIVASVNDQIITLSDLKREAKVIKLEHPEKFGKLNINDPQAQRFFLQQMISTLLIENELKRIGRGISDREVNAAYNAIKKRNKMTDTQFANFLKKKGLTVEEYKKALKERLERIRFFNFAIKSHITITDDQVKAYYEKHKNEFDGGEKVRIAQIFVPAPPDLPKEKRLQRQNLIMRIEAELYKGKPFATVLNEYSNNPLVQASGDLGWFRRKDLMKPIAEAAFKLKKGGVSEVIETKSGFHIIKVLDIEVAKKHDFKDVKDRIERILYQQESEKRLDEWLKKARENANIQIML